MAAFLLAAAPEFIGALFGERFVPAAPIFRVSLLAVVLAIFPMDGTLRARNQTKHIFLSYLTKAIVTVPAVLVGVKLFGLFGGIGAWALAELVGKAMLASKLPAALSTPGRRVALLELVPGKELGRGAAAAASSAAGVLALRAGLADRVGPLPLLVLEGLAFGALYVAGLWVVGMRFRATIAAVRAAVQRLKATWRGARRRTAVSG